MSTRCERAQRNMFAHPMEVRIVELASLRGTPSRAERLVGLAGEIRMKLALHLPRLALLRGRFLERRSHSSLLFRQRVASPAARVFFPFCPVAALREASTPTCLSLPACPAAAKRSASPHVCLPLSACPVAARCAASSDTRLTLLACPVAALRAASSDTRLSLPACPVAARRAASFPARSFSFSSATSPSAISAARAASRISF